MKPWILYAFIAKGSLRALITGLLLLSLTSATAVTHAAEADTVVLEEKPVRVVTSSSPGIFPKSWHSPAVAAAGTALSPAEIERVRPILRRGLAKYPPAVLAANLAAVYPLGSLRYRSVHTTSGTNSRDSVYLRIGSVKAGFTAAHIEGTLHAEFSSILLRNHPKLLDASAWNAANPPGFRYLGDGVDAVKQGKAGLQFRQDLLEKGFLTEYATSNLENDFNGISRRLFMGDTALWTLARQHPGIQAKLTLALAFYQRLDPALTEGFFRAQAPRAKPQAGPAGKAP